MFGKASSSQAPSANKRLFGSSLSVDCQSVFHLSTSFPGDLGNRLSFSQKSMPSTSPSCSALFTIIDGTRQSKLRTWRSSSKNRSCIWMIEESRRGIATDSLLILIDWTGTYIITHNIVLGMKKG